MKASPASGGGGAAAIGRRDGGGYATLTLGYLGVTPTTVLRMVPLPRERGRSWA